MPVRTDSEIGVKRTRCGPNSLTGSPVKSVPSVMTRSSRRISSATASSSAWENVISRKFKLPRNGSRRPLFGEHVDEQVLRIRKRARLRERYRLLENGVNLPLEATQIGFADHTLRDQ